MSHRFCCAQVSGGGKYHTCSSAGRRVERYPGLYRDVQTYLREWIKEVSTGTSESIVVRIFGPDLQALCDKADEPC